MLNFLRKLRHPQPLKGKLSLQNVGYAMENHLLC